MYQRLDDAVAKGARVLAGGQIPSGQLAQKGQFYPPTVLADVAEDALIAQEEIFGPIMCIFRVPNNSDDEAVRMANNCRFALSSCAFSGNQPRAAAICGRLHAGMASVNDLEGTTYLSQSLPFGGPKNSGSGRFAGPEGLRGLCTVRSVVENRASFLAPSIPAQIAYPSTGQGPAFCSALVEIMYGHGLWARVKGVLNIIKASVSAPSKAHHV
mmetsp:Transcript_11263/g.12742  ORF Transcript_11263/g.12742 Transcript_11263/m.12742 type:complete len:213 (+) Transcript_11263:2-640(+)